MKEIPILFSTPMVRAILEGRKSQTRRIVKFPPSNYPNSWDGGKIEGDKALFYNSANDREYDARCPYGQPGDILWVRETFYAWGHWTRVTTTGINSVKREYHFYDLTLSENKSYLYEDCPPEIVLKRWGLGYHKRPSIFMPKEACRIHLKVKSVNAQYLNDITSEDAGKEGIIQADGIGSYVPAFVSLWDKINGPESWNSNPLVWAIEFERVEL